MQGRWVSPIALTILEAGYLPRVGDRVRRDDVVTGILV